MKTIAQSFAMALLLSTAAFADNIVITSTKSVSPMVTTNSYKVAVFPSSTNGSKLHVIVERQPGQSMTIFLKDARGNALGQQRVGKSQGTFRFQFDLAELQDGNYRVEVVSGNDVALYPVTLKTQPSVARTLIVN
ncbi:hypothetical protein M0L20_10845 [Spirosoma sp. RP8]|uniref:T9SS type A sorting domain-containing protein n=1 Tax=Spirosoma liriopis TaxID=2937440 RepID=A0ABT0HJL6_9BACT|nr:hypothetical protein [Spirosoma liriopis]MCK8492348.1 hypothetical protein [Spirosoma liriopis]